MEKILYWNLDIIGAGLVSYLKRRREFLSMIMIKMLII